MIAGKGPRLVNSQQNVMGSDGKANGRGPKGKEPRNGGVKKYNAREFMAILEV